MQLIASHAFTEAIVTPQLSPRSAQISDTMTFKDCSYLSITSNISCDCLDSGQNVSECDKLTMLHVGECILLNSQPGHTEYLVTCHSQANKLCCLEIYTLWSVSRNLWWVGAVTQLIIVISKASKGLTVKAHSVLCVYFVHLAIMWSVKWSNPPVMSSDHGICYNHSNSPWWASHFAELLSSGFWKPLTSTPEKQFIQRTPLPWKHPNKTYRCTVCCFWKKVER